MPSFFGLVSFLSFCIGCAVAQSSPLNFTIPVDPFANPSNGPLNPLRYITSNTLTTIAAGTCYMLAVKHLVLTMRSTGWSNCVPPNVVYQTMGGYWMSAMTFGAYFFCIGLAFRFGLHYDPRSRGIFIAQYVLVVSSPCAFIAADYVLLARLVRHLGQEEHLLIPSRWITTVYIVSDVTTFLVQAAGGSMSVRSNDLKTIELAGNVLLGGLIAQLVSFVSFTVVHGVFLYRAWAHSPTTWNWGSGNPWYQRWHALAAALAISWVGILIRSAYRVAELSEGFQGELTRSEGHFYGLDTLPLWIAIVVYVPFWPGRFIDDKATEKQRVSIA